MMFLFFAYVVNRRSLPVTIALTSLPVSIALTSLRVTDDRVQFGAAALAWSIIYKQRVTRKFSTLVVVWTSICRRLAKGEVEGDRGWLKGTSGEGKGGAKAIERWDYREDGRLGTICGTSIRAMVNAGRRDLLRP